jgi:hypothetical protein
LYVYLKSFWNTVRKISLFDTVDHLWATKELVQRKPYISYNLNAILLYILNFSFILDKIWCSIYKQKLMLMLGWQHIVVQPPSLISNFMHKILIYLHTIHLLKSSTCFKHCPAHLQEVYVLIVHMHLFFLMYMFFLNRCTGQSPVDSDDTKGCIYTITT